MNDHGDVAKIEGERMMAGNDLTLTTDEQTALRAAHSEMLKALELPGQPASISSCVKVSVALVGLMQGTSTGLFGDPTPETREELEQLQQFHFDWGLATQQSKTGVA